MSDKNRRAPEAEGLNKLKRNNDQWRNIADNLYDALIQMKKRRGLDIDDVGQVFASLDNYEIMVSDD